MKLIIIKNNSKSYDYQEVKFMELIMIILRALFKPKNLRCHYCGGKDCHSVGRDHYHCLDCGGRFVDGEIL